MGDQTGSEEPQNKIEHVEALSMSAALGSLTISHRAYLSEYHIQTAAYFARQSAKMESAHRGQSWRELHESGAFAEHRAYVTGAVFAAVAFLEAMINELFADTADENTAGPVKQLPSDARALMRNMWRYRSFRNGSTLNKFQTALDLTGKEQLNTGQQPYQDVHLLIRLRNRLIHFEPEWIAAGQPATQSEQHEVEQELLTKFPFNPLMPPEPTEEHPFYPDKCLSHGCAKWAVTSSLAFADEFHTLMGISSRYGRHRPFVTD
jgi:hypothetical protein